MEAKIEKKDRVSISTNCEKSKKWSRKKKSCCLNHYQMDYSSRMF